MPTVSGLTKVRMLAMEAATVVGGLLRGDNLILTTRDGTEIDVGSVRGNPGPPGPPGNGLSAYPVGALFFSTVATSPTTLLGGGTWERYGKGRTIVSVDESDASFDTVEEVGGSKTHTLTVEEMPTHDHVVDGGEHTHDFRWRESASSFGPQDYIAASGGASGTIVRKLSADSAGSGHAHDVSDTGGGQPHNNMPPYITTYVWRRTA